MKQPCVRCLYLCSTDFLFTLLLTFVYSALCSLLLLTQTHCRRPFFHELNVELHCLRGHRFLFSRAVLHLMMQEQIFHVAGEFFALKMFHKCTHVSFLFARKYLSNLTLEGQQSSICSPPCGTGTYALARQIHTQTQVINQRGHSFPVVAGRSNLIFGFLLR